MTVFLFPWPFFEKIPSEMQFFFRYRENTLIIDYFSRMYTDSWYTRVHRFSRVQKYFPKSHSQIFAEHLRSIMLFWCWMIWENKIRKVDDKDVILSVEPNFELYIGIVPMDRQIICRDGAYLGKLVVGTIPAKSQIVGTIPTISQVICRDRPYEWLLLWFLTKINVKGCHHYKMSWILNKFEKWGNVATFIHYCTYCI